MIADSNKMLLLTRIVFYKLLNNEYNMIVYKL